MPVSQSIVLWKLPFAIWLTEHGIVGIGRRQIGNPGPGRVRRGARLVGHLHRVGPVERPESHGRVEAERRHAGVCRPADCVDHTAGEDPDERGQRLFRGGVVGEAEPGRPGNVRADRDRNRGQRDRRKELLHTPVGDALPAIAAQGQCSPAEPLGVVERARDLLGVLKRIDRVLPYDGVIARVVEAEVEARREIELLPVVPPQRQGRAPTRPGAAR